MSRMMPSRSISIGVPAAGTPLRMKTPLERGKCTECDSGRTDRLEHDVRVADAGRKLRQRRVARRNILGPERAGELTAIAVRGLARVDERRDVSRHEHHRTEQTDGARAEHERPEADRLPGIAAQNRVEIDRGLGGNRERLDQDADLREPMGHFDEVPLVLHHELGQVAVGAVDPAFDETSGDAEVLTTRSAGHARDGVAGPAHRERDQIAGGEGADARTDLDDLAECLVAEHEPFGSWCRCAVVERADFAIRAANADFPDSYRHLALAPAHGLGDVDHSQLASVWEYRQRSHGRLL